jgi:ferredoxin
VTHAQRAPGYRIRVDPIACEAHGLCAELLPEHVELDEWGYPIVVAEVSAAHRRQARRAVTACPTLAVRLEPTDPPGPA